VAFLSVIREGIETSVLIWSTAQTTNDPQSTLGAILGLVAAAVLGTLLYRGAIKINLSTFFKYTGTYLIVVAAGILAYGIGELQEIGALPFLHETAYNLTWMMPEGGALDSLLRGLMGFKIAPTLLEVLAWWAFIVPTAAVYLRGYSLARLRADA
jgi:high-affinity iron transporter